MEMTTVASNVEAVTVYSKGALVSRTAELDRGDEGFPSLVRLSGLPLSMSDDSIRVRVEAIDGDGASCPRATDVRVVLEVPEDSESLGPVTPEALKAARLRVAKLEDLSQQQHRERERLGTMTLASRPAGADGEPPVASPLDARVALVTLRERERAALTEEIAVSRRELEAANRELAELESANERASNARRADKHELRKAVLVTLVTDAGDAHRVRLVADYRVPGARWAPVYSLRLDRSATAGTLEMRAVVGQRSGEDWRGAALRLSTAEPQRWSDLPELSGVRIGRRQSAPAQLGWRPPPTGSDALYRDWDAAFNTAARRAEAAEVKEELDSLEYPDYSDDAPVPVMSSARAVATGGPEEWDGVAFAGSAAEPESEMMDFEESAMPPSAAMAPPPSPAPQMMRSAVMPGKSRERRLKKRSRGGPTPEASHEVTGSFQPPEEAADEVVGDDLLRYGELRMGGPAAPSRGRLTIASRRELYLQLLVREQIAVSFDVLGVIATAEREADNLDLPSGTRAVWSRNADHAYVASSRIDVPSDGVFHGVPIARGDAEPKPQFVVVPRESTDVFRTLRITNPLGAPLLAGPVDVYLGGDFMLTSELDFTPKGGTIVLGLGVEQAIKVSRNTLFREETAGLIGGSLELHHQIIIEVQNNLERAAAVEIRERLPTVAKNAEDEIKVACTKVVPAWKPLKQDATNAGDAELKGGHCWHASLEAGASQTFRADYTAKISSKHELIGGNRREA